MWQRAWLAFVVFAAVGCDAGPKLAPVSGKVTLDGKPLAGATVSYYPITDKPRELAPLSSGKTNAKGEYSLETVLKIQPGAVVGRHRVSVTMLAEVPLVAGGPDEGDAPAKVIGPGAPTTVKDKVPPKYQGENSELTMEIPPGGKADADFALKSR